MLHNTHPSCGTVHKVHLSSKDQELNDAPWSCPHCGPRGTDGSATDTHVNQSQEADLLLTTAKWDPWADGGLERREGAILVQQRCLRSAERACATSALRLHEATNAYLVDVSWVRKRSSRGLGDERARRGVCPISAVCTHRGEGGGSGGGDRHPGGVWYLPLRCVWSPVSS